MWGTKQAFSYIHNFAGQVLICGTGQTDMNLCIPLPGRHADLRGTRAAGVPCI